MIRPPLPRTLCHRGVVALIRCMHRAARVSADAARVDRLMIEICHLRSARRCSMTDLDLAAAKYAAARLAIAKGVVHAC